MIELLLQCLIAFLRERRAPLGKFLHLRIIINIEMLGLQHMPVELCVLDFVSAEVEELSPRKLSEHYEEKTKRECSMVSK